jgi:hypothetical protein
MRAFIAAVICAAAIGVGASYALHMQQETVDVAFSSSAAHVGDPGHNLVGLNRRHAFERNAISRAQSP